MAAVGMLMVAGGKSAAALVAERLVVAEMEEAVTVRAAAEPVAATVLGATTLAAATVAVTREMAQTAGAVEMDQEATAVVVAA